MLVHHPGRRAAGREAQHVAAHGGLCTPAALGRLEHASWVDLPLEPGGEGRSSRAGHGVSAVAGPRGQTADASPCRRVRAARRQGQLTVDESLAIGIHTSHNAGSGSRPIWHPGARLPSLAGVMTCTTGDAGVPEHTEAASPVDHHRRRIPTSRMAPPTHAYRYASRHAFRRRSSACPARSISGIRGRDNLYPATGGTPT